MDLENVLGESGNSKDYQAIGQTPTQPSYRLSSSIGSVNNDNVDINGLEKQPVAPDKPSNELSLSNTQALMHMLKGSIGTGILTMPIAFKHAGLWAGLVIMLVVGVISAHSMTLLVRCSHILSKRLGRSRMDYSEVAEYCLKTGPARLARLATPARIVIDSLLTFTQFGVCATYIVFTASSVHQVVEHFQPGALSVRVYQLIVTATLLPLILIRRLKHLAPFATIANILMLVATITIIQCIVQDLPPASTRPAVGEMAELPLFFGIAFFSAEGIGCVLPIENMMRDPEAMGGLCGVVTLALTVLVAVYGGVGFFGYLKFGSDVASSITLNLPQGYWLYLSVNIVFAASIFFSYLINFHVFINIVWKSCKDRASGLRSPLLAEYAFRTFFLLLTCGFALAVPHLDLLISLIGACACAFLSLIFPAMIEVVTLSMEDGGLSWWIILKNGFIVAWGLFGGIMGTYSTMRAIIISF